MSGVHTWPELSTQRAAAEVVTDAGPQPRRFESTTLTPGPASDAERTAAQAVGYANGWSQGVRQAHLAAADQLGAARAEAEAIVARARMQAAAIVSGADTVIAALRQAQAPDWQQLREEAVDWAVAVSEAVLTHELAHGDTARVALDRALDALDESGEPAVVSVCAADAAVLRGVELPPGLTIRSDANLRPGDTVVRTGSTTIDARMNAALQRAQEELAA